VLFEGRTAARRKSKRSKWLNTGGVGRKDSDRRIKLKRSKALTD
jgi:hypothetical protein